MILLLFLSSILTVAAFIRLVRATGYSFRFIDGYHTLNYSQLASMIPGGIWGFAGLGAALWSKGISKADSALIIVLNTVIMLTACAMVGITGLAATFGWGFALVSLFPFLFLVFGRNRLDRLRKRYLPESSQLPATRAFFETLLIGIAVWVIASLCFAWLLFTGTEPGIVPLWTASGAYAAAYLGGYLALFAPSGLGVSEGLVTLLLGPAIGTEKVLSVAISFRIVHTLVTWGNILLTLILTYRKMALRSINQQ
ncbi:MAG: hypothetical protein ACOYYU_05650 [Chloroflexota bacterium]